MVLGTAFTDQAEVLGADPNFSVSGTFTPRATPARTLPTGVAVPCRFVVIRTDPKIVAVGPGGRSPGILVIGKRSEILDAPREGDEIALTEGRWAGSYIVQTLQESHFSPYWRMQVRSAG